ncbi:hypothetical protein GM921_11905 [Pedobacter sp. LMG 31464]|uniref:Nuclear transport factor 2 family protein n=1 Tax=Pedobacter planticolens TaxID=2679964 RepID=A0A923DY39_9SPHI|nr:hypothetical protein [Pedobacter planticolens]MBB2146194.1 hypothetical protein [Pedobacter planticolens]
MKIKLILLVTLTIFSTTVCHAQNDKMYNALHKAIKLNDKAFYSDEFYEKAHAFSINIGVNNKGIVDTVIISKKDDKELNKLFDFKTIINKIQMDKLNFIGYKNELLALVVMVFRGDDYFLKINNGDQLISEWLAISSTTSKNEKMKRKQIFLSPIVIESRGKPIKN